MAVLLAADLACVPPVQLAGDWAMSHRGPFGSLSVHHADEVWNFIVIAPLSLMIIGVAVSAWLFHRKRRRWLAAVQGLGLVLLVPMELLGWSLMTEPWQLGA